MHDDDAHGARPPLPAAPPPLGALRLPGRRIVPEVLAGVTLAALCLPLNIGYAEAAGLPPSAGINATILPLLVYAVFAGSRHLVVGPDATVAAFLAATIGPLTLATGVDPLDLATATALLVGVILAVAWLLRIGNAMRYLSRAVVVGFIAGIAIEVLTSQVVKILGVTVEAERWPEKVVGIVRALPDASAASVAVGVATIVLVRVMARFTPALPGALLALTAVSVVVAVFEPGGVRLLGEVPSGLPLPSFPSLPLGTWLDLAPAATAIAVLVMAEGLLIAKHAAHRHRESFDSNAEILPLGLANAAASMTSAMPCGPSASRTAALDAIGTRSQVPAVVAGLLVAVVAVAFTGLVAQLPTAALAGLVASAVVSTIDVGAMRRYWQLRRSELLIAGICGGGVLAFGPLAGIVVAVLVSVLDVVRRLADAPWATVAMEDAPRAVGRFHAGTDELAGLRTLRPGSALFFANAIEIEHQLSALADTDEVEWVVIDLERVSDVDPTAGAALLDAVTELADRGKVVGFSRVDAGVAVLLERYGIIAAIGPDRLFTSNREARIAFTERSTPDEQGDGGAPAR